MGTAHGIHHKLRQVHRSPHEIAAAAGDLSGPIPQGGVIPLAAKYDSIAGASALAKVLVR